MITELETLRSEIVTKKKKIFFRKLNRKSLKTFPEVIVFSNKNFFLRLGEEPSTFREVVDAYSMYLSQRGVRWDLSYLYPGLVMRIGPSLNGAGVLEFLMEKRLDYHDRAKLGPGTDLT